MKNLFLTIFFLMGSISFANADTMEKYVLVDSEKLVPWLEQRVSLAKKNVKESVTMPLAFRGPFGCVCPLNFVGTTPWDGAYTGTWISPVFKTAKPKYKAQEGTVVLATGYFTGKIIKNDLRKYSSPDNMEAIYQLKEFVVQSYTPFKEECSADIDCVKDVNAPAGCCAKIK